MRLSPLIPSFTSFTNLNEGFVSARTAGLAGLSLLTASCSSYEGTDATTLLSITGGTMGAATILLFARRLWPSSKADVSNAAPQPKAAEQPLGEAATYYSRGIEKEKQGDFAGSIQDLTKAIEFEPQNARYWMRRGSIKHESGDHLGAIDDHTHAIGLDENYAGAYFQRAMAYEALDRITEAMEDYRETKKRGGHGGIGYYADRSLRALEQKMAG